MFTQVLEGLMELSDHALDARIRDLELERRRVDAEMAAAIAVAEHRQLPAVDGHRTLNAYLRATINCSSSEASRLRGVARAVDHVEGSVTRGRPDASVCLRSLGSRCSTRTVGFVITSASSHRCSSITRSS